MLNQLNLVMFICILYVSNTLFAGSIFGFVDKNIKTKASSDSIRVITLTPNLTELVYSAGGEHSLVGVVGYSDFPLAAKKITSIGSFVNLNYEKILSLKPDVLLAWRGVTSEEIINKLKKLGLKVLVFGANSLEDIAHVNTEIGVLLNSEKAANKSSEDYLHVLKSMRYSGSQRIKVFVQIWNKPLMSLNGETIFSKVAHYCGAKTMMFDAKQVVPQVNIEAVLKYDPDVILHSNDINDFWSKFTNMKSVVNKHIYKVNSDHINRATLRTIKAVKYVCKILKNI